MERLGKSSPAEKLSNAQKKGIAEADTVFRARVAERELATREEIEKAISSGHEELVEELRARLAADKIKLEAERDAKRDRIRGGK